MKNVRIFPHDVNIFISYVSLYLVMKNVRIFQHDVNIFISYVSLYLSSHFSSRRQNFTKFSFLMFLLFCDQNGPILIKRYEMRAIIIFISFVFIDFVIKSHHNETNCHFLVSYVLLYLVMKFVWILHNSVEFVISEFAIFSLIFWKTFWPFCNWTN